MRGVDPAGMLWIALGSYGNAIERKLGSDMVKDVKVSLLVPTTYGNIFPSIDNEGRTSFHYDPNPGFVGDDQATFLAEYAGKRYKIVLKLKVFSSEIVFPSNPDCPYPTLIWLNPKRTSTAPFDPNGIAVAVADLPNSALGQTTGTTITLDTNAAGYNWFIDPTPFDNSEFLPTANPNEWIAKADSEAAGKMDMLSVLLHEYGHALGIGHSAHAGDYMATTLQPGVRRLPSAAELELMAQLAGEIKNELADASSNTPLSPQSPLPSLPLGGAFGVALLGRLRGTRYSGWTNSIDSVTQYAIAANPKLSNPDFAGASADQASGWSTTGKVRFQDGAATLTETAESQTRLNQVFIVGETDRFLSFTVANAALDDATNAPDDALRLHCSMPTPGHRSSVAPASAATTPSSTCKPTAARARRRLSPVSTTPMAAIPTLSTWPALLPARR